MAESMRTMSSSWRQTPLWSLLLVLFISATFTACADELPGVEPLLRSLASELGLASASVNSAWRAAQAEPLADTWAIVEDGQIFAIAAARKRALSGPAGQAARRLALREVEFDVLLTAFLPEISARLSALGETRTVAARRALRYIISSDLTQAVAGAGAVVRTKQEGNLALAVLTVPRDAVHLIVESRLETHLISAAYGRGLRDEAMELMSHDAYCEALKPFLDLQQHADLTTGDQLAVASCFAECGRPDDAAVLLKALLDGSDLDQKQLLRCGDIAMRAEAESLAVECYERCAEAMLRGEED